MLIEMRVSDRSGAALVELRDRLAEAGGDPRTKARVLEAAERWARADFPQDPETLAVVLSQIATSHHQLGQGERAHALRAEAVSALLGHSGALRAQRRGPDPRFILKCAGLARRYIEEGDPALADRLVAPLSPPAPPRPFEINVELYGLLADAALGMGDAARARELSDTTLAMVDRLPRHSRESLAALRGRARILEAVHEPGAEQALARAVEVCRGDPTVCGPRLAEVLHEYGAALIRLQKRAEAVVPLREALALKRERFGASSPEAAETAALLDSVGP
jgi:hypothetical protein